MLLRVRAMDEERFADAERQMSALVESSLARHGKVSGAIFTRLSDIAKSVSKGIIQWGRSNSLWPAQFGLACCALELMDFGFSRIDAERKGYLLLRSTPRQNDVMIVAGWVTKSMAPRIKRLYEQMASPKYVVAFGECATSGGPWWESYNIVQGIDQILPVDVYVAGCPPMPENLMEALMMLQQKVSGKHVGDTERYVSEDLRRAEIQRL